MARSVRRLPAHHGAGEGRHQPGAARPRMVQGEVASQIPALRSGPVGKSRKAALVLFTGIQSLSNLFSVRI